MSDTQATSALKEMGSVCQNLDQIDGEQKETLATLFRKMSEIVVTGRGKVSPACLESFYHIFLVWCEIGNVVSNIWQARLLLAPESYPTLANVCRFELVDPREVVTQNFPDHQIVWPFQARECVLELLASRGLRLATEMEISMAHALLKAGIFADKKVCSLGYLEPQAAEFSQMLGPICSKGNKDLCLWIPAMPANVEPFVGPKK